MMVFLPANTLIILTSANNSRLRTLPHYFSITEHRILVGAKYSRTQLEEASKNFIMPMMQVDFTL
jgi:hypothetical protein